MTVILTVERIANELVRRYGCPREIAVQAAQSVLDSAFETMLAMSADLATDLQAK